MKIDNLFPSNYAPAERSSSAQIIEQSKNIYTLSVITEFLDSVQHMSVVLNANRQIIFSNQSFINFLGVTEFKDVFSESNNNKSLSYFRPLGQRPGEATQCVNASNNTGGCGTSLFCRTCGAVNAIIESQTSKKTSIKECRMSCHLNNDIASLNLRIWSRPIKIEGNEFTILSIMDTGDQKRRLVLEQVFYHDILNTVGGMQGLSNILSQSDLKDPALNDISVLLHESAENLMDEINGHRTLNEAESGAAKIKLETIYSKDIIESVSRKYSNHPVAQNKHITITHSAQNCAFISDHNLTRRVLINLVKNALEASTTGEHITLNCMQTDKTIEFTVHNPAVMPISIQLQIFNRSFSTKGENRGVGTYSIKLLAERYLQGKVSFISSSETGTIFKVQLPLKID